MKTLFQLALIAILMSCNSSTDQMTGKLPLPNGTEAEEQDNLKKVEIEERIYLETVIAYDPEGEQLQYKLVDQQYPGLLNIDQYCGYVYTTKENYEKLLRIRRTWITVVVSDGQNETKQLIKIFFTRKGVYQKV